MRLLVIHPNFPGQFKHLVQAWMQPSPPAPLPQGARGARQRTPSPLRGEGWGEGESWDVRAIARDTAPCLPGFKQLIRYKPVRAVRADQHPYLRTMETAVLHGQAEARMLLQIKQQGRRVLERSIVLRDRNELLASLQESLLELSQVAAGQASAAEACKLASPLVAGMHVMLETLADAGREPDAGDLEMLRLLTHDRSEMMDLMRRRMETGAHSGEVQQAVFAATTLFERCVWLLRRYVLLLVPATSAQSA